MPNQVVILHGWSDTSRSFRPLANFLEGHGYRTVPLWLGDYISLDDDVRVEDVAKRMEDVVQEHLQGRRLRAPFDLIVHSTGGLVARRWLANSYPAGRGCPVKRLIMLAPANFGSRLASLGRSMLGRIVKGWNNWFQTGDEMLRGLELASPLQWDLALADLFVPEGLDAAPSPYGPGRVWPFVITGTHPYPGGARQIINEDGSDGTVRVVAANLNAQGVTIDFAHDPDNPRIERWQHRHGETFSFPFAVLPNRTHSSIVTPDDTDIDTEPRPEFDLARLLLAALRCETPGEYRALGEAWHAVSEATAALAEDEEARRALFQVSPRRDPPSENYFHQYFQIVARVLDDHGAPVPDFFLEFFGGAAVRERHAVFFHKAVLEHVHPNSQGAATRALYIDRTDLLRRFYPLIDDPAQRELSATITAAPPGGNVRYFGGRTRRAGGRVRVHAEREARRWLTRNSTHLVKIVIPRDPEERIFRLTRA